MNIIIIGAGGQSRVVIDILEQDSNVVISGIVDNFSSLDDHVEGYPIIGKTDDLAQIVSDHNIQAAIIAVGNNKIRKEYFELCQKHGLIMYNAIHPDASIAPKATIGIGNVIAREAIICTNASIGNNTIINTGSIIEHESIVADHAQVCPGVNIAGRTKIKESAFIGIGVTVIHNITIGANTVIGAGSVVITNIEDNCTAVGVPCKVIKK